MVAGILIVHLHLPGCTSLKEKRGRLKPLLHRLHREFNISVAETDLQNKWQEAVFTCVMVANETVHIQSALDTVRKWVEGHWPDGEVLNSKIEMI